MYQRPAKITRVLPNEWEGLDPEAGWVRHAREPHRGWPAARGIRWASVAAGLLAACFAYSWACL